MEHTLAICMMLAGAIVGVAIHALTTTKQERTDMAKKISELSTTINGLVQKAEAQLEKADKAIAEVTKLRADFEALKKTLEDVEIPAEAEAQIVALDARLDSIAAKWTAVDDVNPDAPIEPAPAQG